MAVAKPKGVHAYLTEESHAALFSFSADHGVSVSAMLEVLAQALRRGDGDFEWLVEGSRKVDAERRRRHGGRYR
jgi:hypothetical protein